MLLGEIASIVATALDLFHEPSLLRRTYEIKSFVRPSALIQDSAFGWLLASILMLAGRLVRKGSRA